MSKLKELYTKHPFLIIGLVGIVFRIIAVFFSQGYAMHDDHFVYIETSFSWLKGLDIGGLLHQSSSDDNQSIYNYLYPKILYFIFKIVDLSPKESMYFIRFIHALWSMVTFYFGYKIALKISTKSQTLFIAWLLAILWIFPFLSVRNLVEFICVPFLMIGIYLTLGQKRSLFISSLFFALAISFRFQVILVPLGIILGFIFQKKWKESLLLIISLVLFIGIVDGTLGLIYFHKPFGHIINYIKLNILTPSPHTQGNIFTYLGTLASFFIVLGPFFMWSVFTKIPKKNIPLWGGFMFFFVVHSLISNKQERFLFPILPLFIILAISGLEPDSFLKHPRIDRIYKGVKKVFWGLNLVLLLVFTTYYCKKSRVELMDYFNNKNETIGSIVIDYYPMKSFIYLPTMYMNYKSKLIYLYNDEWKTQKEDGFITQYDQIALCENYDFIRKNTFVSKPAYIVFFDKEDFSARYSRALEQFPAMKFEKKIESSYLDVLIHKINPVNDEATFYVYKTNL